MYLVHFVPQQYENEAYKYYAYAVDGDGNLRLGDDHHVLLNLLNQHDQHHQQLHLFLLHRLHLL
jgi:meiotically up-regulated gene 157 (Mug157) protein